MKYRSEIDGLRALAVIPVVLFHAGFSAISGGFLGVDVFFTISGFLITSIILGDMDKGRFSLLRFYERRAKRILPALFIVMIFSIIAALILFTPQFMQSFSKSLIAVSTFTSNMYF
ncbi:MAG: acyltransferase [Alphaproteobacteria bacterium]|nr:acyltransferase [Alphaproteobacteria bacterium]